MGTMRRRARQRGTNANGCAEPTRRRGSSGDAESSSPERSPRRDRHRARDRRSAAAGRAGLSFPLCNSPRSRSIDDAEHRRRPVRGPPACSSAGTSLRAPRRRRRPYAKNHNCRRSRRPDDGPAVPSGLGPAMTANRGRGAHGVEDPSAGLPFLGRCGRSAANAATCLTGLARDRPRHPRKPVLHPPS